MFSGDGKIPSMYPIPTDLKKVLVNDVKPFTNMSEKCKKFLEALKMLKKVDQFDLRVDNYVNILKFGLHLEEYEEAISLKTYNIYEKHIDEIRPSHFCIHMKSIDDDHPLKNCCHTIAVSESDILHNSHEKYYLKVKGISKTCFYVGEQDTHQFSYNYHPQKKYNIKFCNNNYTFRCCHYAISRMELSDIETYLFPQKYTRINTDSPNIDIKEWKNKMISKNQEQKEAVINIVNKTSYPAPYILYGPPGTGKTATLVETICQIYDQTRSYILVCTPSNAAADEVTKRLLNYIPNNDIYRFYSNSMGISQVRKDIKICSNVAEEKEKNRRLSFSRKRIIISTLCTATKLLFRNFLISYVFIDESGQATEPESLIAFSMMNRSKGLITCQIIIAGDPQQLGPTVKSKYAEPILGQSILERLMKLDPYRRDKNNKYDSRYITKLLRNYRSHPAIIHVPNKLYYENELIPCRNQNEFISKEFPQNFPMIFHGVDGKEVKKDKSFSCYNKEEIQEVMRYVKMLIGKRIGDETIGEKDIGIVTPFVLQRKMLQDSLKERNLKKITVGTVETFQGQEKNVIIVSTVRSKIFVHEQTEHLGFLSSPRRLNVALTRARSVLIVVGNPYALRNDPHWRYFIQYCRDNDATRGIKFVWTDKKDEDIEDEMSSLLGKVQLSTHDDDVREITDYIEECYEYKFFTPW